jgi:hypothetical protein
MVGVGVIFVGVGLSEVGFDVVVVGYSVGFDVVGSGVLGTQQ